MILLDTCAIIWGANGDPLEALYLSPVSAWEIGLLASRGKLELPALAEVFISQVFARPGVRVAALTPEIAGHASYLPGTLDRDPADRMLAATALIMGLQLVTRDHQLLSYGAQGHIRVLAC